MRRGFIAAVVVLGLWPGLATAVDRIDFRLSDTQDLVDVCTVGKDDALRTQAIHYCVAYLEGAVDYHDAITDHKDMKRLICYPPTVTRAQGVRAFIEWGQKNQGDKKLMGEPTVIGVVRALAARWPCKH